MIARRLFPLVGLFLVAMAVSAATWEGNAVVGGSGDFPEEGSWAACNSFPKDSSIEIRNLENGKLVKVTISGGTDNPGIFLVLSPRAATELGMSAGVSSRIRATVAATAADSSVAPSLGNSSVDPDFNPRLLAARGKTPSTVAVDPAKGPEAKAPPGEPVVPTPPIAELPIAPPVAKLFEPEKATLVGGDSPASPAVAVKPTRPLPEAAEPIAKVADASVATAPGADNAVSLAPLAKAETPASTQAAVENADLITAAPIQQPKGLAAKVDLAEATVPDLAASDAGGVADKSPPAPEQPSSPPIAFADAATAEVPEPNSLDAEPAVAPAAASLIASDASSPASSDKPPSEVPEAGLVEAAATDEAVGSAIAEAPEAAEAVGPAEIVLSLEPTGPRPPVPPAATEERLPPAKVAESVPVVKPGLAKASVPNYVDRLEKGAYYVQVGVFGNDGSLVSAVGGFPAAYPVAAEMIAGKNGPLYRLYVGPVARDESGLLLLKLKALGYRDAFLRKGQ